MRLYVNSWDRGKSKNVVAYILSRPTASAFLSVLLLPSLLFLTQMFTDGASFRFLMKQIGSIPLADLTSLDLQRFYKHLLDGGRVKIETGSAFVGIK